MWAGLHVGEKLSSVGLVVVVVVASSLLFFNDPSPGSAESQSQGHHFEEAHWEGGVMEQCKSAAARGRIQQQSVVHTAGQNGISRTAGNAKDAGGLGLVMP